MTESNTRTETSSRIDNVRKYLLMFNEAAIVTDYTFEKHLGFLDSIHRQLKVKGSLSPGQQEWLNSLCLRYSEEQLQEGKKWSAEYSDQMKINAERVAQYYLNNPPYFGVLAKRTMSGYNLSKSEYSKMCNNKYAQKILAEYKKEPRFAEGSMVQFRKTDRRSGQHAVVLSTEGRPIIKAVKGAREYKLLPVGSMTPIYSMEKNLKRAKRA